MTIHAAGILGLVVVFILGTTRPVNLGVLSLVMTFLVASVFTAETGAEMVSGFPTRLFVLLAGVTYLFGIATVNGTVERIVSGAVRLVRGRRAMIPWIVFAVASLPAMAGALGSAGVALLAPLSMRLAERYEIDRRMIGLMVVHGAAAGNFSPLNVLGALVQEAVTAGGLEFSYAALFFGNLAYNVVLAAVIYVLYGGLRLSGSFEPAHPAPGPSASRPSGHGPTAARSDRWQADQVSTVLAIAGVAVVALGFGLDIGLVAFTAAAVVHLVFPSTSRGAEKEIAWGVVLLVCGVVTYVGALMRFGTVDLLGTAISGLGAPLLTAYLLCLLAGLTSAIASSAGILGALIPLAVPFMATGQVGATGMVVALALSATVVDASPFSTVGALAVANASPDERDTVYVGLLKWGGAMILTAPVLTWVLFVLPAS